MGGEVRVSADRNAFPHGVPPSGGTRGTSEADAGANVRIRSLTSLEDCNACVGLQREIWGDESDIVPAALLHVVDFVGGVAAGAFVLHWALLRFLFRLAGISHGGLAHSAHILRLRPSGPN